MYDHHAHTHVYTNITTKMDLTHEFKRNVHFEVWIDREDLKIERKKGIAAIYTKFIATLRCHLKRKGGLWGKCTCHSWASYSVRWERGSITCSWTLTERLQQWISTYLPLTKYQTGETESDRGHAPGPTIHPRLLDSLRLIERFAEDLEVGSRDLASLPWFHFLQKKNLFDFVFLLPHFNNIDYNSIFKNYRYGYSFLYYMHLLI